jgi:hypothetical protein
MGPVDSAAFREPFLLLKDEARRGVRRFSGRRRLFVMKL